MADSKDEATILGKIQEIYVPFLKKLIAFLEKTKKATPENLNRLKSIYTIFTTASVSEQIETFHVNEKKLEKWYKNSQKEKNLEDGEPRKGKRTMAVSDTDSSQGAFENAAVPSKRSTFKNTVNTSESSQLSISSVRSISSVTPSSIPTIPLSQIKKEKIDDAPKAAKLMSPVTAPVASSQPAVQQKQTADSSKSNEPITFTCASCQFQTLDEAEFMKHARTDHRTDLSMWCKQCGKCFSNAGVLVSHIKERACVKEEMIYRCGVKDCTFETTSGQTFVHHLRHCHKGSPFIFCVHCQKIFTLPHCLILHMQDDCPFKDKNRRNPGSGTPVEANSTSAIAATATAAIRPANVPTVSTPVRPKITTPAYPSVVSTPKPRVIAPAPVAAASNSVPTPLSRGKGPSTSRGRRGSRGKGRGRPPSESSDSDDPDDPSWRPEESLLSTTLRRSGRWAKKVNDVINVEPSLTGEPKSTVKKPLSLSELNAKEMLDCPCCDFMAAFQSVLEDHYIAHHKVPNKNACLVCHLKFESTKLFLDHFDDHAKGKLTNQPPSEVLKESTTEKTAAVTYSEEKNNCSATPTCDSESSLLDNETFEGVVKSISEANVVDPTSDKSKFVKIPYQAAIHDKNLKDSRVKKFEGLKSPNDLVAMKNEEKLKHFFKCVLYNCIYTTDNSVEYKAHLESLHSGKRLHCGYCLKEFFSGEALTEHMLFEHSKRQYQCSNCFYRAYSKIHVQIHVKNYHSKEQTEVYTCPFVEIPKNIKPVEVAETMDTTWPYICAIGTCNFQSFDPKEFKKHNERVHRSVSVFFCHYCKVDFISFKRLLNHYRLHGINTFQCNYCIHGSETKDEILLHLCNAHADQPLKAYMRGSQEDASSEVMQLNVRNENSTAETAEDKVKKRADDITSANSNVNSISKKEKKYTGCEDELYHVQNDNYYPKSLKNICSDLFCGIPYCNERFENVLSYVGHLRHIHAAVNFACPYCPEMLQNWDDFKNHLICHGPDLYACSAAECGFYNWDKNEVTKHIEGNHPASNCEVVIVRESYNEGDSEVSKVKSLPRECPFDTGADAYECLFCKYKSSDCNIMKNHFYSEMAYKRFCCRYCNTKFISRKDVKNHFSASHADCDIKCLNQSNPEVEVLVRKVIEQKITFPATNFESCFVCCRKFKSFVHWQSHLCLCLFKEYRPYECAYCGDNFSSLKSFKYHLDEKHDSQKLQFAVLVNYAIEEEISKMLLQLRLKYLKDMLQGVLKTENIETTSQKFKLYTCSICPYEADFKEIVEKHIENSHKNEDAVVNKSSKVNPSDNFNVPSDENSNDSLRALESSATEKTPKVKRFRCGFCIKKMFTIQELESHVEGLHPVRDEVEYFYYFSPDTKIEYSPDDKEIFECAYCKSCKENLFALKKHADIMHSEMQFKVKGYIIRHKSPTSYLACGYCYMKLENFALLKKHTMSTHPSLPEKSIGGCVRSNMKRIREDSEDFNKRIKLGNSVFVCSHCGCAFSNQDQVTIHSKQAHARLQLEYKVIQSSNANSLDHIKFHKCEFCPFIGEKQFLDKHLSTKHKMRVSCFYCKKRFEFASKLKEHHDIHHKGLPVKYSQETVSTSNLKTEPPDLVSSESSPLLACTASGHSSDQSNIPEGVSHYGKSPEPIDLSKLIVSMDSKEGQATKLSLEYFSQMFNIFPKVILKDVKKE